MAVISEDLDRRARFYYAYTDQGVWWFPDNKPKVRIVDMEPRWRRNAARWMLRCARAWEFFYSMGEILALSTATMRNVIGVDNGKDIEAGPTFSQLDLMSDSTQDAFDEWTAQRRTDPVAWLRDTVLYRAVVTADCCNGTGHVFTDMGNWLDGKMPSGGHRCTAPDCPFPQPESAPEHSPEWQAREARKRTVGKHHLIECPMYPGGHPEVGCTCDDYSPEWTLS